jgi:hypothetical protein
MLAPGTRKIFVITDPATMSCSFDHVNEFKKPSSRTARATLTPELWLSKQKAKLSLYPRHALTGV